MTVSKKEVSKVDQVNAILLKGEPGNVSHDSYSNYTGYSPQATIDAVNEVFGVDGWGYEDVITKVEKSEGKVTISKVAVWISNKENTRSAYGQSRITKGDVGDALKGAQTDALKKALASFSIGNRAYLGLLAGESKQTPQKPATKAVGAPEDIKKDGCPHENKVVITSHSKNNPGRKFNKCDDCQDFLGWVDEVKKVEQEPEDDNPVQAGQVDRVRAAEDQVPMDVYKEEEVNPEDIPF